MTYELVSFEFPLFT